MFSRVFTIFMSFFSRRSSKYILSRLNEFNIRISENQSQLRSPEIQSLTTSDFQTKQDHQDYADIQTNTIENLITCVITSGELGFMEAYIDGKWSSHDLVKLFEKLLITNIDKDVKSWKDAFQHMLNKCVNYQTIEQSKQVIDIHYNISNTFYRDMLGPTMQYSCAYWQPGEQNEASKSPEEISGERSRAWKTCLTLDEAQEQKMELIAQKLKLTSKSRVLDIGCGFGTLAKYLSESCSEVVGCTLSEEQYLYACETFSDSIKSGKLRFILCDYRNLPENIGVFDRIVSVGFLEHVGVKNLPQFASICNKHLIDTNGILLIHTIGKENKSNETSAFIRKYIFPGGELPTPQNVLSSFGPHFRLEDWHNFGKDYAKTLKAWQSNFMKSRFKNEKQNRIWELYLSSTQAAFSVRKIQLYQIVFTKKRDMQIEYVSVR